MANQWSGRRVQRARQFMAGKLPAPCARGCGRVVLTMEEMRVGHVLDRVTHPHLIDVPSNWQIECRACSDGGGQRAVIAKAKADALREAGFSRPDDPGETPPLPSHTYTGPDEPVEIRAELTWTYHVRTAPAWLQPYLELPLSASPPLAMTPVHPEAVGSYGPEAIEWIEANVTERGRALTLRWWQRLAIVMQLQHREDGSLCMRKIVESTPRRAGKSVRLVGMALWRVDHSDLFGEDQLVLFCGKDLGIAREIHRKAWAWADVREGWDVRRGVGQEEVNKGESRWLVRSLDSVYGFDVCQGAVDEAWSVPPAVVTEGIEPATLERLSPQLLLTSTAHRRATSLMKGEISAALAAEDGETLLLWWGVLAGADIGDPETWRLASPHWSEDRARMIESKYTKALAGEVDPDADDPDPLRAFESQYLNMWKLRERKSAPGDQVVTSEAWAELLADLPDRAPDAVACEGWAGGSLACAFAWRADVGSIVQVVPVSSVAEAAELVRASGCRRKPVVGKSLAGDPSWRGRTNPKVGSASVTVAELARLLRDGLLFHDGSAELARQVTGIRTKPSADGLRVTSADDLEAVKSAVWAVEDSRAARVANFTVILPDTA